MIAMSLACDPAIVIGDEPTTALDVMIQAQILALLERLKRKHGPSLADVIKMVHPKPATAEREALYAWAIERPHDHGALPELVKALEAFRREAKGNVEKFSDDKDGLFYTFVESHLKTTRYAYSMDRLARIQRGK